MIAINQSTMQSISINSVRSRIGFHLQADSDDDDVHKYLAPPQASKNIELVLQLSRVDLIEHLRWQRQ
jgi:hypothetical protein